MRRVPKSSEVVAGILIILAVATTDVQLGGIAIGHWVARVVIAALAGLVILEYVRSRRVGRRFVPPRPWQLALPGALVVAGGLVVVLGGSSMLAVLLVVFAALVLSVSVSGNVEAAPDPHDKVPQSGT